MKHAEILALEEAGERARGATVYVTLEPCSHTGRTAPCADALIAAGVAKVVAASTDPNPLVAGEGFRQLARSGHRGRNRDRVPGGSRKAERAVLPLHAHRPAAGDAEIRSTLDGKIAAPDDNTGWITSERARAHVQELRHASDAIITGIGTALADDPLLTDRSGLPRARPLLRVVLDSTLRLPLESQLVQTAKRRSDRGGHFGRFRRNAAGRSRIAGSKCRFSTARAAASISAM